MAIAIAVILLLAATVVFHFLSPWNLTPLASNWGAIDTTIEISFWVTGFVYIAVNLFMVWCILRYRYKKERRSAYEPENKKLEVWLTVLSTIGIAALLAPGLLVWQSYVHVPDDAHNVEVVGQQWHWMFRYPGDDGELGRTDPRLISYDNRLGIDPDDPAARDDIVVTSPRVYLPVDRPVRLNLRSRDVLHNFTVANFRAKMDLLPGQVSYIWLTPTVEGEFNIMCAELCGIGHFAMRGEVRVVGEEEFQSWLEQQTTFGELQAREAPDLAAGERHYGTCVSCHGEDGQGNRDLNSPAIAGLPAWYIERQLKYFRNGVRGAHEDDQYGGQMTAFANTLPGPDAIRDVAGYIEHLEPEDQASTVDGNVERGKRLYRTCGACHGRDGEGRRSTNAPRLAGVNDWYHLRQLRNFQEGVRGAHPDDMYGPQMRDMSRILTNEDDLRAVIAYIDTLTGYEEQSNTTPELAGRNN